MFINSTQSDRFGRENKGILENIIDPSKIFKFSPVYSWDPIYTTYAQSIRLNKAVVQSNMYYILQHKLSIGKTLSSYEEQFSAFIYIFDELQGNPRTTITHG